MAYDHSLPSADKGSSDVVVSLDSVAIGGVTPQVGDTIQIPAKVTRIEGDDVYATPQSDKDIESEDQERSRLKSQMDQSQSQDTENPGY